MYAKTCFEGQMSMKSRVLDIMSSKKWGFRCDFLRLTHLACERLISTHRVNRIMLCACAEGSALSVILFCTFGQIALELWADCSTVELMAGMLYAKERGREKNALHEEIF